MKKCLLVFISFLISASAYSQYNFYKLSGTVGAGPTSYFGDLDAKPQGSAFVALDYNFTPFMTGGVEVQKGYLAGDDKWNRAFKNSFLSYNANVKVNLGQFVDFESSNFMYAIRNLYIGTGIGMIKNNHVERAAEGEYIGRSGEKGVQTFAGGKGGSSLYVPVNFGYRFDIQDRFGFTRYGIVLNYQFNTGLKDNLDGYYNDPVQHKNTFKDFYSLFTIGARICFGPEGLY